jgi:hypothetical protein
MSESNDKEALSLTPEEARKLWQEVESVQERKIRTDFAAAADCFTGSIRFRAKPLPMKTEEICRIADELAGDTGAELLLKLLTGLYASIDAPQGVPSFDEHYSSLCELLFQQTLVAQSACDYYLITQLGVAEYEHTEEAVGMNGKQLFRLRGRWNEERQAFDEIERFDARQLNSELAEAQTA